jgi:hypothetical protein
VVGLTRGVGVEVGAGGRGEGAVISIEKFIVMRSILEIQESESECMFDYELLIGAFGERYNNDTSVDF